MLQRAIRLLAFAIVATASAATAWAQPVELKVSHYLPPNHTVQKVLEDWAAELEQKSGGRLKLRVYPASQLGPVQRQFDLARNGQADMAVGLTGVTPGRYPMSEIANLPFVQPKAGATSAIMSRRMTELAPKYLAPEYQGLRVLWVGITPRNTVFTAGHEIDGPADLHGLKIRFQGEQVAKVLRALGASPLPVPPGEIADGLSKGVIDGAMFNFEAAESFGLQAVTKHVMEPAFVTGTLTLVMNAAKYDGLPADLRKLIDETTGPAAAEKLGQRWDLAEAHGRETMLAAKVAINTLSPAELEKFKAILTPLVQEDISALDKSGKPASQMLADYTN